MVEINHYKLMQLAKAILEEFKGIDASIVMADETLDDLYDSAFRYIQEHE